MNGIPDLVFKIVTAAEWAAACASGTFLGAPVDHADGFIHLSAPDQVVETATKHFRGARNLILVAVDPATLGEKLRWEPSRGGALFPHLYAALNTGDVLWAKPLPLRADGAHDFRDLLP